MLAFEIRINNAAPMIVAADNHVIADFTTSTDMFGLTRKYIIMMRSISVWPMLTRKKYQFH